MTQKVDVLTDQIMKCAEMGMSQGDIADLLRVTPSTVSRVTNQLGIKLKRKKREFGPNNDIYTSTRESESDNSGGAEDGDAAQFEAAPARTRRTYKNAEERDKQAAFLKLQENLGAATTKEQRYEVTYAHCLMEFEKLMQKRGLRPSLPCNLKKGSTLTKSAFDMAQRRRENGVEQGEKLFRMLSYDQRITASEAAGLLGDSIPRTSSYLKSMFESDKLYRVRDLVVIDGQPKKQWRWVFSKQPIKALYSGFEREAE